MLDRFLFMEESGFFVLWDQSRLLGGLHSVVMKEQTLQAGGGFWHCIRKHATIIRTLVPMILVRRFG
ncbi:hypothetical protein HPY27_08900 [Brevibacillus sp. HB1.1]|uniref:hypothetical protein n=1 Tax=Brevibacillus TaxID=55080 RepID=UPI001575EF9A|nr:hypothetical protein [Brevibacillus sp. HB1.1]NTU30274.1 hypothetical protein [Brevibacillus sp. HB1.1]